MSGLRMMAKEQLIGAGYAVASIDDQDGPVLLFESDSVLGFVLCFADATTLLDGWQPISERVLQAARSSLRRDESKAWNAYLVFLAEAEGDYGQNVMLGAIEEDLVGTRKLARAGIASAEAMRAALLPLLAIQNAPRLEAVDMPAEIRLRTTELPNELIEVFLRGAPEGTLAQLLDADQ